MTHSQEPWLLWQQANVIRVEDVDGKCVTGGCLGIGIYDWLLLKPIDAERIVACVNFCAGVPTETLTDPNTKLAMQSNYPVT